MCSHTQFLSDTRELASFALSSSTTSSNSLPPHHHIHRSTQEPWRAGGSQTSGKDLSLSLREARVCSPQWDTGRGSSFKMDGNEKGHRKGKEGKGEEGAEWARPGGAGKELGESEWGSGAKVSGGGSMLGWPSPSSWDLPPTRPKNSLAHSLGRAGRAGQGRASPASQAGGAGTWGAMEGPHSPVGARRAAVEGSEGSGPERGPQGRLPATSSSAGPTFCHQRGRGRAGRGAPADWAAGRGRRGRPAPAWPPGRE